MIRVVLIISISNYNLTFCKQTEKNICILLHLIWVSTVCLYPIKRTQGLYELTLKWPTKFCSRFFTILWLHEKPNGSRGEKTCLRVSDHVMPKPACSATETSWNHEILLEARFDMILSNKRIRKALIRLGG